LKSGFKLLAITPEHAIKTIDLQDHHKNPFDRILIAQSLVEPLHPLTADAAIAKYSLPNIIKA
jgi:PIN domain nuclease of toxin-antitoxin system